MPPRHQNARQEQLLRPAWQIWSYAVPKMIAAPKPSLERVHQMARRATWWRRCLTQGRHESVRFRPRLFQTRYRVERGGAAAKAAAPLIVFGLRLDFSGSRGINFARARYIRRA